MLVFTRVHHSRRFEKDLDKVPEFIRVKALLWIHLVETLGLREVRKKSGYHDEPLQGRRLGQRSVRLNQAYRLLYREVGNHLEILLLEVSKHDY